MMILKIQYIQTNCLKIKYLTLTLIYNDLKYFIQNSKFGDLNADFKSFKKFGGSSNRISKDPFVKIDSWINNQYWENDINSGYFNFKNDSKTDQSLIQKNRETLWDKTNIESDFNSKDKPKDEANKESVFEIWTKEQIEEIKREYTLKRSKKIDKPDTKSNKDFEDYLKTSGDPFGKNWKEIELEAKQKSKYWNFETYKLRQVIFKSDDDLRQELLAIQLMKRLHQIFKDANVSLFLRPYEITITSCSSGYIEWVPNAISIDSLLKSFPKDKNWTLWDFFNTNI